MNLIKFNPSFDNLIDEFFNAGLAKSSGTLVNHQTPKVNVREENESFVLEVAVPGMNKEDIHVSIEKDQLVITGEMKDQSDEKGGRYTRREFHFGQFKRSYHLPDSVDSEKISAKHDNGVLEITIPKQEKAIPKTKSIEIS